ncbi:MAG TPA: rhomboid family intramembrane serine protease [Steroidobacter sp.]
MLYNGAAEHQQGLSLVSPPLSASLVILVLTVVVSLVALFGSPKLLERSLFRPYWLLRRREYDTVILSALVHADLMHLIFNMLTFYFFAFPLEARIGRTAFVVLYLAGLLVSHAQTYHKQRNNPEYASLGASGAISAVLFAAIVYFPRQSLYIIPIPVPIPAPLFAVGYLAYTYYASKHPHGRINHDAHLGGALTGLVFVALTEPGAYGPLLQTFF